MISRSLRSLFAASLLCFSLSASIPAHADQKWVEVRSPHFSVITDAGEKRGRDVALRFEQMRTAFGVIFQRVKVNIAVPLEIIAFRNGKELKQYAPLYEGKPVSLAGFFQGGEDRNFIAVDLSGEDNWGTVFHEYAHLLINSNLPPTPLWFDEGFAEYCSSLKMDKKEISLGLVPPDLPQILSQGRWLHVVDLFSVGHGSKVYNRDDRRSTFYAQSWLTVHYIMSKQLMKQVAAYNNLVQDQHVAVPDAIRRAFGMEPEKLEKEIGNYLTGGHATYFKAAAPPGSDEIPFNTTPLDELEVKTVLADLDYHARDYQGRGIAEFQEIVSKQPENSAANRGLGYAALQKGDLDQASVYFRRAAASDSKDPRVHFFLAMLMSRNSRFAGEDPEDRDDVIKELKTAISLDPNYADAYSLLGMAHSYAGDDDEAEAALKKAVALGPRNPMYLGNLANVYLRARKIDEAVPLLKELEQSDNPQAASMARENLRRIETYKAEVAQAPALREAPEAVSASANSREVVNDLSAGGAINIRPDPRPVIFMKGKLVSVDCSAAPKAVLTIAAGAKAWKMTTSDPKKLVVMSGEEFSCTWTNRKVAVNYRKTGDDQGELISVELQ